MADISQINLPDGNTYNIKDASATDTKVTQTSTPMTDSNSYPVLLAGTADDTTKTEGTNKTPQLTFRPVYGELTTRNTQTNNALVRIGRGYNGDAGGGITVYGDGESTEIRLESYHVNSNNIYGSDIYLHATYIWPRVEIQSRCKNYNFEEPENETGYGIIKLRGNPGHRLITEDPPTIILDGLTGKVTCNKMSVADISDQYTITKTSGNWKVNEIGAVRSGNTIHIRIEMSGNGSSVSSGSNGFVGTITAGPLPVLSAKLVAYYNNCPIMLNIEPDGDITARVTATSVTVTSSGSLALTGTFITND